MYNTTRASFPSLDFVYCFCLHSFWNTYGFNRYNHTIYNVIIAMWASVLRLSTHHMMQFSKFQADKRFRSETGLVLLHFHMDIMFVASFTFS